MNICIFTFMNIVRVRMVNIETSKVTHCSPNAVRDLKAIGFIEQPLPSLDIDEPITVIPQPETTKPKTNATNKRATTKVN